jgi:hypothetical protein
VKYKTWFLTAGSNTYATNALEFDSVEEAENYAFLLALRWTAVSNYKVLPRGDNLPQFLTPDEADRLAVA